MIEFVMVMLAFVCFAASAMDELPFREKLFWLVCGFAMLIAAIASSAQAADYQHRHDMPLPAPESLWNSCCHDHDCVPAPVSVQYLPANKVLVKVGDFNPVTVDSERVHASDNGKSYVCTLGAEMPPTADNLICVFYAKPNMVRVR